jgi:hypothetical protein
MPRGPTVRQVYALAAALCVKLDLEWPESRDDASGLIERLRSEIGHPCPRLEDCAFRRRTKWERRAAIDLHDEIVEEFLVSGRRRRAIERP